MSRKAPKLLNQRLELFPNQLLQQNWSIPCQLSSCKTKIFKEFFTQKSFLAQQIDILDPDGVENICCLDLKALKTEIEKIFILLRFKNTLQCYFTDVSFTSEPLPVLSAATRSGVELRRHFEWRRCAAKEEEEVSKVSSVKKESSKTTTKVIQFAIHSCWSRICVAFISRNVTRIAIIVRLNWKIYIIS